MPPSEKRLAANRANAQKSTGPRTPAGKQNSALNGIRHGVLCNSVLIDGESRVRFTELLTGLHQEFLPQSPNECALVESMAVARWRLTRLWALEAAGITHEMRKQAEADQFAAAAPHPDLPDNPPTRAMLAFRDLCDRSRHLDVLSRYETRYDRQYHRAVTRLFQLRSQRNSFCHTKPPTE